MVFEQLRAALRALRLDRSGATAIEYALIALLIALVLISAMLSIGTSVTNMFMQVNSGF